MIKPLNNVSNTTFKGSLQEYQEQIKSKQEPRFNLTLSPGSDQVPPKPGFKQSVANVFKGFNNVAGVLGGAAKGLAEGVAFGSLAGVVAKNFKQASQAVVNEAGKNVKNTNIKEFIGGIAGDISGFVTGVFKSIPSIFSKSIVDNIKEIGKLPQKYMEYLGKGNRAAKAIAIGVAVITLGYNIIKSKIMANRKNADLDHSWNIKH